MNCAISFGTRAVRVMISRMAWPRSAPSVARSNALNDYLGGSVSAMLLCLFRHGEEQLEAHVGHRFREGS